MVSFGPSNSDMATLGARFGDPVGPNLELLTKGIPKMTPKSSKCPPKVTEIISLSRQNVNKNDMIIIICKASKEMRRNKTEMAMKWTNVTLTLQKNSLFSEGSL